MDDAEILTHAALFRGVPLNGLTQLAEQGLHRTFERGEILMTQGETSSTMHVIVAGKVRVERNHPDLLMAVLLAELGPGEVVGEMGVLDDEPRSATVTASEPTETVELGQEALMQTIVRYPEVSTSLLRMLSKRIRSTDELMERSLRQQMKEEPQ